MEEGRKLLLVESEADIRESLRDLLATCVPGLDVSIAPNAEEARRLFGSQRFDLLITDYGELGEDGLHLESVDAQSVKHVEAFLPTPIEPQRVLDVVGRLLGEKRKP